MAQSDLILRQDVFDVIERLFKKYKVGYKPEGNIDEWGFGAEIPQELEAIDKAYDVDSVLQNIDEGQRLNIPHQGYCMNKDIVKSIIENGWYKKAKFDSIEESSDDVDRALQVMKRFNYCGECIQRGCKHCGKYNAKKQTLIALQFYREIQNLYTRLQFLKDNASSEEESKTIENIQDIITELNNKALDNSPR